MERASHRPLDRAVAIAGVLLLGALIFGLVVTTDSPAAPDPTAAGDLIALMRAGERTVYVGTYTFTRTLADHRTLPATIYDGHGPHASVYRSGTSLTVDLVDASYDCELLDPRPECFEKPPDNSLPESEVVRVVVAAHDYDVSRLPPAQIAGERAECFAVAARVATRQLPDLGPRTEMCFAADGVPLRTTVTTTNGRDDKTAVHIARRWDDATLAPALAGFEGASPNLAG